MQSDATSTSNVNFRRLNCVLVDYSENRSYRDIDIGDVYEFEFRDVLVRG